MVLNKLKNLNNQFIENGFCGESEQEVFNLHNRSSNILLTAPHATKSLYKGKKKASDMFTGALTLVLGEKNEVSTIVRKKFEAEENHIIDFVIANELHNKFVLDIHGIAMDKEFELAIGTGLMPAIQYQPIIEEINSLCQKYDIKVIINHPDYRGVKGLTYQLQKEFGCPNIIQLEWRKDMRDFYNYSSNVMNRTIPFMDDLIEFLRK